MFDLGLNQDPKDLWKRYGIALVIILAFLFSSHVIESGALAKAERDAEVINLSGKQRMLSQQIILYAQNYVSTGEAASADRLEAIVDEFEITHQTLMQDAVKEASLGHLYMSRTPSTDEVVKNYISIARSIPSSNYPRATLAELKSQGSGEVLSRLDEAAIAFQHRAQTQARWSQRLQELTLLFAALVVLLEALIIFLPAHRLVEKTLSNLKRTALTDPLTKLRNRTGFDQDLDEAVKARDGKSTPLALILFDLDDFKNINDQHGHMTGDAVLKRIGVRVSRIGNLLSAARVGGDEFAVLVDNAHWSADAPIHQIADDVRRASDYIFRPVNYQGRVITISGSIGLSRYPVDAKDPLDLRRNASTALLDAKRTGRGRLSVYNKRIDAEVQRRRTIQSLLTAREYKAGLSAVFQPIVESKTGKIKSVEVLARWKHETLGPVNPLEFLTIAREAGLGQEVERAIREIALTQMGPALKQGLIESVSLNVSPVDLAAEGFAASFIDQVKAHDVALPRVWVEVTETERLSSMVMAKENLELLSQAGIRIALDDYGVGYSNIHRLAELPIHRVKIDKSIVENVEDDPKYAGVFRSSVQLARALGAEVVAEGVETAGQLSEVERFGCRYIQGYFFYRPLTASDCLDLLNGRESSVA